MKKEQRKNERKSNSFLAKQGKSVSNTASHNEATRSKELDEALRNIPLIGHFLVYIVVRWGWAGIILFLAGALSSFLLIFFNLVPEKVNDLLDKRRDVTGPGVTVSKDVNWSELISKAKSKIQASGYFLNGLDANSICKALESNKSLTVDMVIVDPEGNAICVRQRDENNPQTYGKIVGKINEIYDSCDDDARRRLRLEVIDLYPTMSVVTIDGNLYAYFYGQDPVRGANAYGTRSPVLTIPNYSAEPMAEHFTSHLMSTLTAGRQVDYAHYKSLPGSRNCTPNISPQK